MKLKLTISFFLLLVISLFIVLMLIHRKVFLSHTLKADEILLGGSFFVSVTCESQHFLWLRQKSSIFKHFFGFDHAIQVSDEDKLLYILYGERWACFDLFGCDGLAPKNGTDRETKFEFSRSSERIDELVVEDWVPVYVATYSSPLRAQAQRFRIVLKRNNGEEINLVSGIAGPTCIP